MHEIPRLTITMADFKILAKKTPNTPCWSITVGQLHLSKTGQSLISIKRRTYNNINTNHTPVDKTTNKNNLKRFNNRNYVNNSVVTTLLFWVWMGKSGKSCHNLKKQCTLILLLYSKRAGHQNNNKAATSR